MSLKRFLFSNNNSRHFISQNSNTIGTGRKEMEPCNTFTGNQQNLSATTASSTFNFRAVQTSEVLKTSEVFNKFHPKV